MIRWLPIIFLYWRTVGCAAEVPNVVIIFCDDLGYADIGAFGCRAYPTPNLDRMAAEGRKFTRFYVSSPVCSASRAAMLTGCFHGRVGIHGALGPLSATGLNPTEMSLARLLKQKNYATAIVGKWHLGRPVSLLPMRHGFDEYFGLPYSNDMWPKHPEAAPGSYPPLPLIEGDTVIEEMPDQALLTTRYTERAVKFIERNKSCPFFLYMAHAMPHVPLFVSDKFKGKSGAGLFGDVIMEIDWSVGRVMETLEQHGLSRNTLVVFTSDNGPWLSYGEHAGSARPLREGKGTCWEGGVRVPCIMRWPDKIPANTQTNVPLSTVDLLPTIARLAEAPLSPHRIDGVDVWSHISGAGGAAPPDRPLYFYYTNNQLQAVLHGKWKLYLPHKWRTMGIQPPATNGIPGKYEMKAVITPELYDLEVDESEQHNAAAGNPKVLAKLMVMAENARADLGDSLTGRQGAGVRVAGMK